MQSLMANQTARGVSDRLLKAERAKGAHMNSSLNSKDKLLHDLQAQVRLKSLSSRPCTSVVCWLVELAAETACINDDLANTPAAPTDIAVSLQRHSSMTQKVNCTMLYCAGP